MSEASGPGWFWTQTEWAEWSNELASMIPEDDVARYANVDGAQESIIADCLQAYVTERKSSVDDLLAEVRKHHVRVGIMASPTHWAYRGDWKRDDFPVRSDDETPGKWFARCSGDDRDNTVGCGWESEPTTYETREEAWVAAHTHIAESIKAGTR